MKIDEYVTIHILLGQEVWCERDMFVCRGMSLDEFKFIYWMEYTHRMWGRVLGLVFAVPAVYFVYRGWVNGALGRRLGLLFAMGATQGFVGWWMVRSGLQVSVSLMLCRQITCDGSSRGARCTLS